MHSPLALRSKIGTAGPNSQDRRKLASLLIALVLAAAGAAGYFERGTLHDWIFGPAPAPTIPVSGNIEAHQSVLGFKTVQSRIVELPFDEGESVDAGTLIARLDDSDYRQQVAVSEAAVEVQKRQLAAAEHNLSAAQQTVEYDAADLEFREAEYKRADFLLQKGAGTVRQRDQTYAAWPQSTAAHQRDQALHNAAERQEKSKHSCTKRTSRWFAACVLTESGNPWRSTIAMIFRPFPRFVAPISAPPPLAMTNVASMKHSSSSSAPLSRSSLATSVKTRRKISLQHQV